MLSEYFEDTEAGTYRNGILCQNLMDLTFDPESFDIVISEAVVEHVPDPLKSFNEVHRVLTPGGIYIFNVPFESEGETRTRVLPDGTPLCDKKFHRDPLRPEGILVYTDFSKKDFVERMLQPAGFTGEIRTLMEQREAIFNCDVVVAMKPTACRHYAVTENVRKTLKTDG